MKEKASVVAQKLLNLYRQEHVIFGGWAAVNQVFVDEATPDVLRELRDLPTGKNLIRHIENLRSGKTPMDSIERELLPYGGMMDDALDKYYLTEAEWRCIDRLENCLEKLGLRSDNVRTRRMERFISVYMACGGSAEDAADSALVSLVLPRLVLTDRQTLAEAHLPETLNSAFGQDAIPQSRGFLRRAGLI